MRFVKTDPDSLPPEAVKFLHAAYLASPCQDENFWEILRLGEIYLIRSDEVMGAICLEYAPGLVNIALLGGKDMESWRDEFVSWGEDFMKKNKIEKVLILGRAGWGRMFKNLKTIGTLYST